MRALEQGGGVTPISDATRLQRLLDAGTLTLDRLTDKGRAVLLNQAIESGKLTFDRLTPKGRDLLVNNNQPSIAPHMAGWQKGVQLAQSFRTTAPGPSAAQEVGRGLLAGTGDVVGNIGATAQWLGALRPPTQPTEAEKKVMLAQSFRTTEPAPMPTQEGIPWEGWKTLLKPEFYTRNVSRAVPFSAALVIPSLAVSGGVSSLLGLGAFGKTVLGTIVGGVAGGTLNRGMESAMEAGGAYQEALAKGMAPEEANKAADTVFKKNLKLVGLDIAELITTFMPGVKVASKLGKVALTAGRLAASAGEEAYEEALQEKYQREALGEPFSWKAPGTQEAMAIGGLMGAGLGAVGEGSRVIEDIQQRAVGKLSPAARAKFNQEVATRTAAGTPWPTAAREALDALAGEPTVKAAIEEATKEAVARYAQAQTDQRTYEEQAGTTMQAVPTEKEVRTLGADYRDTLVELQPGDKVQLANDPTSYTVTATPSRVWRVTIRDDTGKARTVSKDDVIADYAILKDRLTRRLADEAAKKAPKKGRAKKEAVAPAAATPTSIWTPTPTKATPEGKAGLTTKPVQPISQPTPTPTPSAGQIVAPGAIAPSAGRFPGAGRVAVVEPTSGTIQDITSELLAKKAKQEGVTPTQEAWTGRTPDVLKQTVQRIETEQGGMAKAVKEKFGEEGFVERQVTGVANLFAEMRAKDEVKVTDAEVEKVLSATKSATTAQAQIVNWFRNTGAAFKDVFSYEWRLGDYPRFQDQVRRFQGAQRDAQVSALETYLAVVSPMDDKVLGPRRFKLFSRLIDLRDMLEDVRADKLVAGNLTEEQLVIAEAELMAKADDTVKQSLKNHDDVMKAAWQELQRRNKVSQEGEGREHYYPHRVLDYMREIDAKYPGLQQKLKAPYRYYLKKRGGTTRMFETDYLTVTMNHLTKLYLDNATDDFALETARDYDQWPKLSDAERQRYGGAPEAGRLYEIGDERYFGWSYDAFHRTKNPILTEITDPLLVQADLKARQEMQKFLSQVHVIPEEIANRIAQLKQPAIKSHTLNAIRGLQWMWKNIVLGPLGAGIPYQIGNFIGDTINLAREAVEDVAKIPAGWKMAGQWQRRSVTEQFQYAIDIAEQTRVGEAGLMRAGGIPYDPMLAKFEPRRYFLRKLNIFQQWRTLGERRELSVRFAKLLGDLERIQRGEAPKVKMFDVKKLQEGGMTPIEIAGKVAREFGVDYGKLTPEGRNIIRDLFFPFSTFYVQNFQNWVSYVERNPGEFTLKFLVPLAALAAFNALCFPEEEDKLPLYYRVTPHLITGHETPDGKPIIISFQTPVDLAAKFVGLEIVGDLARQVLSGKKDIGTAAKELAINIGLAPLKQMWGLFNVFPKAIIEAAMNENTFTHAPIVSDDIKDTPEGIRQRLNYVLQQWFTPYGQYARAARDIEPEKALSKWLLQGPADIKRALGIREVDLERETVSRFYDELDRLSGAHAVWKDKREHGEDVGGFTDLAQLRRFEAVASDFTDQWKAVSRIKADKTRTQEEKDEEVRERYKSMARRAQTLLNPGK